MKLHRILRKRFSRSTQNIINLIGFALLLIFTLASGENPTLQFTNISILTPTPTAALTPTSYTTYAEVTRVIDGDTIIVDGGVRVRYIGINTPELSDKKNICLALLAKEANEKLVLDKRVRLVRDVSDTDKFGRLLRYVYVGDTFVNDRLVRDGFAAVSTFPPDVTHQELFLHSQTLAREKELGAWSADPCDL